MSLKNSRKLFKLKPKSISIHGDLETDTKGFWAEVKIRPITPEFGLLLQDQFDTDDTKEQLEAIKTFGDRILIDWNIEDNDSDIKVEPTGDNLIKVDMSIMMLLMKGWSEAINSLSKSGEDDS